MLLNREKFLLLPGFEPRLSVQSVDIPTELSWLLMQSLFGVYFNTKEHPVVVDLSLVFSVQFRLKGL
jgi:hypothetical protein